MLGKSLFEQSLEGKGQIDRALLRHAYSNVCFILSFSGKPCPHPYLRDLILKVNVVDDFKRHGVMLCYGGVSVGRVIFLRTLKDMLRKPDSPFMLDLCREFAYKALKRYPGWPVKPARRVFKGLDTP